MNPKRILVTGGQGFIGSRVIPHLNQKGHFAQAAKLDLLNFTSIRDELQNQSWDTVLHLAGMSHVPTCESDPELAFRTNLAGTALLLEGVQKYLPKARIIFASTAQVYAAPTGREITEGVVFDENREVAPQNVYAQSKWQAELLLSDSSNRGKIHATILRLFNHTHHTQSPDFFLPHLYQLMSKAKPNQSITIPVGNLDIERDIGSVHDLMAAMTAVIETPSENFSVYNVCSGYSKNLRKLAEELAKVLNIHARFEVDPNRIRAGEPKMLIGSYQKIQKATGWQPKCQSEEKLIQEFLQ